MGAVGVSIEVSGDGDRAALHEAIWDEITEWVRMYTADSANEQVLEYVLDADTDEDSWGAVGDSLLWMFPDCAGCCNRSADAWAHWAQLALASEWDRIVQLADEHELRITSEPRTLDELLVDRPGYVSLRGNLWDARENGLYGDSESLELSELDDNERARYQAARVRCMCGPCTMLRPDADIETAMVRGLAKSDTAGPAGQELPKARPCFEGRNVVVLWSGTLPV